MQQTILSSVDVITYDKNRTLLLDLKLKLNIVHLIDMKFKSYTYIVSTNRHNNYLVFSKANEIIILYFPNNNN